MGMSDVERAVEAYWGIGRGEAMTELIRRDDRIKELTEALKQQENQLRDAAERDLAQEHNGEGYRNGVFTNCGYVGTASGYIVRDGTWWVATFRWEAEADQYVAMRNARPLGERDAG